MPVHQTKEGKKLYKKETYHSDKLVGLSAGVKQKPVAVIVGDGGTLEIANQFEMKYSIDICNMLDIINSTRDKKVFSPIGSLLALTLLPELSLLVTSLSAMSKVAFLSMGLSVRVTFVALVTLYKLAEQVPICCSPHFPEPFLRRLVSILFLVIKVRK